MFSLAALAELDPSRRDVVIAQVGAAAAFAGLVLVFLGVLVTSYQTLLGQVGKDTLSRFRTASWLALGVFVLGLASVTVSTLWLVVGGGECFYQATLSLFFAELVGLLGVAVYSTWRVLLR